MNYINKLIAESKEKYSDSAIAEVLQNVKTPSYITSEGILIKNLKILKYVEKEAGCNILLAQKAFSQYSLYPLIREYITGTTASGLYEAKLGKTEMGGETHVFAPAYKKDDLEELLKICDHIIFNSFSQWQLHKERVNSRVSCGIRINPEISTQEGNGIYDPCSPFSRLGVTRANFKPDMLYGIEGLHFHTLCEQNVEPFEKTLNVFIENFGEFLPKMKWVNFGGGHHITREDYELSRLVSIIKEFKKNYDLKVYLEPGEAVALNAGFFVTTVLDIIEPYEKAAVSQLNKDIRCEPKLYNTEKIAILDGSAACHMPDVLEMPYTPKIIGAAPKNEKKYNYILGGNTCLAGDIIGKYSFDNELKIGDKLIFKDMAIYSMVKNNTFNGIPLPSIGVLRKDGKIEITKEFSYLDFKDRL